MKRYETDVLIAGGGGAGLTAAYYAAKENVRVTVVNKGKIQRTGATITAPGAISAVDDRWKHPDDSVETMIDDTIKGGSYVNDRHMVESVARESAGVLLELERMGAIFQRKEDGTHFDLRIDGGHSYPRCPYLEDRTGKEMLKALSGAMRSLHVNTVEDVMIISLLKDDTDGSVTGALGIDLINCECVLFDAKAVILSSGGGGTLYENTDNPADITGDGFALALKAGAQLRDMEFVQFYPVGFLYPPTLKGELAGLMYHCHLINSDGKRFMEDYDPENLELSTRDLVSRAIVNEIAQGRGTPMGGVYMDLTYIDTDFLKKTTPAMYATYLDIGKDPSKDYIEVAPTVHFIMGGMAVDGNWESGVPGLFGAGETCGGMHGANRLSQNALAEILVSGKHAGSAAAAFAKTAKKRGNDPIGAFRYVESIIEKYLNAGTGRIVSHEDTEKSVSGQCGCLSPAAFRKKLRHIMWEYAGVIRNEDSLKTALSEINELESAKITLISSSRYMNREICEALENENLLMTAKAVVYSALARRESRGAHFRDDFPESSDEGLFNNYVNYIDGVYELSSKPVACPATSTEPEDDI